MKKKFLNTNAILKEVKKRNHQLYVEALVENFLWKQFRYKK